MHKKGISELQPHKYFDNPESSQDLLKLFELLHEQHAKNSAIIIASIALLTDELVKIDPPDFRLNELPFDNLLEDLKNFDYDNN